MSKIDNIFKMVISDADFMEEFDVHPESYGSINDGYNASNLYVRAVSKILLEIDKTISDMERDKRIRNIEGKIELPESFKTKLYKMMIKELAE